MVENDFYNYNSNNNFSKLPVVSVIVATYRRDSSLEQALLSLIKQTYDFIEIVVVDDNSDSYWNDKVSNIVNNISKKTDKQFTYIKNETNKGSANTRNTGIEVAIGNYVSFLDDDDLYMPNKIKNQVEHMIDKESDFSITDLNLYDENDRIIEKRKRKYIKKYDKESLLKYHLMYHMTGTDTLMFKKDFLIKIGGFPPIDVGDEFYLFQKAIEAGGRLSYLPECHVKAYVHSETDGLSSGESKIKGENELYNYKKQYFDNLSPYHKRYINMRHNAVLAFAEFRRKNYGNFIRFSIKSFISSPINCLLLFLQRK
jgi:glycosyltransferase involved in cell wall biosynthesis